MRLGPRHLVAVLAALAAALAFVLQGCGGGGNENADPASVAPNGAPIYVEVTVQPDGEVRTGAEDALAKILRTQDVSGRLVELVDQGLEDQGLRYERDLKPWLGSKGAFVITSFGGAGREVDAAAILAASDTDKAVDSLERPFRDEHPNVEKREHRGVEYMVAPGADDEALGGVGDFAVVGSEAALRAVIDAREDDQALADDERYKEATDRAPDDRLATFYADPEALADAIRSGAGPGALGTIPGLEDTEPVVGGITADGGRIVFEVSQDASTGADRSLSTFPDATPLVGELPADSWAAFGLPNLGEVIDELLKSIGQAQGGGLSPSTLRDLIRARTGIDLQRDVIDWAGDIAFFARGERLDDLQAGAVIEAKDPKLAERGLEKLGIVLERQSGDFKLGKLPKGTEGKGFTIEARGLKRPIEVVTRGNRAAIVYGRGAVDAALDPRSKLSASQTYRDAGAALGGGIEPSLFVAARPLIRLAENETGRDDAFQVAKPYLETVDSISAGSKREGDRTLTRLVIRLR